MKEEKNRNKSEKERKWETERYMLMLFFCLGCVFVILFLLFEGPEQGVRRSLYSKTKKTFSVFISFLVSLHTVSSLDSTLCEWIFLVFALLPVVMDKLAR